LVQEERKDPITKFFSDSFTEIKNSIDSLTENSGEYTLNLKKEVSSDWQKFKLSWKNMIEKFKYLSPRHKRFKKLYNKIKAVELKVSEIKEDTTQIKLEISEVATMIEQLMEGHEDLETYMKENLGSDWKVLKNWWKKCKKGDISKWEFAKIGLKKVGKKFAGIFIRA
jgi:chromosome segregation ATPase